MPKLPERARLWVKDYLTDSLTAASGTSFAVAGTASYFGLGGAPIIALLATGAVGAVGSIYSNRRHHRPTFLQLDTDNETLKSKVAECEAQIDSRVANLVDVVKVLLRDLAIDLDIYKADTRLSVYKHSGDQFYLVGRVSLNESYAAVGRLSYPDTQGFIGEVWHRPDERNYVAFPKDRDDWLDTQVKSFEFTNEEAGKLKMQTAAMMATKLRRDPHGDAFGVLCIECDRRQSTVKAATIDAVRKSPYFHTLTSVLSISLADLTHEEVKRGFLDRDVTR